MDKDAELEGMKIDRETKHALQEFGKAAGLLEVHSNSFRSLAEEGIQDNLQLTYYVEDGSEEYPFQFLTVTNWNSKYVVPADLDKLATIKLSAALKGVVREEVGRNPACGKKWTNSSFLSAIDLTNYDWCVSRRVAAVEFAALVKSYQLKTGKPLLEQGLQPGYWAPGQIVSDKLISRKGIPCYVIAINTVFKSCGRWKCRFAWVVVTPNQIAGSAVSQSALSLDSVNPNLVMSREEIAITDPEVPSFEEIDFEEEK